MSEVRLAAEARTEFGKGGARRTRRAGKIPAVIYGHGADPRHVSLPAREFTQAIKHGANILLTLSLEGKDELAIPKAIQRDPIRGTYEHIDLLTVRRGEKVTIELPLLLVGNPAPGGLVAQELNSVSVEAEATNLPAELEVSIEGLEIGSQITAADLVMPEGTTLVTDAEALVIHVAAAPTAEDIEADIAEAADELGIVEDEPESEKADDADAKADSDSE